MDIIFGWLTRPHYKWTVLDTIMLIIEIALLLIVGGFISDTIDAIKQKRKKK